MKTCKHCGHTIRKIKGIWKHRKEHTKYSGVTSGGVTFNELCTIRDGTALFKICGCRKPEPKILKTD